MPTQILSSAVDIRSLGEFWGHHQQHPNGDLEYYLSVCASLPGVLSPWVLVVSDRERILALVAGRLESKSVRPRIGYLKLPGLSATSLSVVQGGIIGEASGGTAEQIVSALLQQLQDGRVDFLTVHKLPQYFHGIWRALAAAAGEGRDASARRWTPRHRLNLTGKEPGFLLAKMSSKHRYNTRRQEKKFLETCGGAVEWQWLREFSDFDDACRQVEQVAARTYQRGLGAGFINDEVQRQRLSVLVRQRQLRLMLLRVDGQPRAYWMGTLYAGVFHSVALGYTPEVAEFGAGHLMLFKMVDRLIDEGASALDFGSGDAEYKERFSDETLLEADATVYARRPRGLALRGYCAAAALLDRLARDIVSRLGIFDRLKRRWRDGLMGRRSQA